MTRRPNGLSGAGPLTDQRVKGSSLAFPAGRRVLVFRNRALEGKHQPADHDRQTVRSALLNNHLHIRVHLANFQIFDQATDELGALVVGVWVGSGVGVCGIAEPVAVSRVDDDQCFACERVDPTSGMACLHYDLETNCRV